MSVIQFMPGASNYGAVSLQLPPFFSSERFDELRERNPELRFECTAEGVVIVMAPGGSESSGRNAEIIGELLIWNRATRLGRVFDSSELFEFPNGAKRAPDAAWIASNRWNALTQEEREGIAKIAPDFVVELRSPSDRLGDLQAKMEEYIANGVRLGWLIDPETRSAWVHKPGVPALHIENAITLSGEDVLPGFVLDLSVVW